MPKIRSLFDRLFDKALVQENGCWEFCGYRRNGYGRIKNESGTLVSAHIAAYELCIDDIPRGMKVLHTCDNPSCVNPNHLFLGTQQDNVNDMIAKGRKAIGIGVENGAAWLTENEVREIKLALSKGAHQPTLAIKYKVHRKTISRINCGHVWGHINA